MRYWKIGNNTLGTSLDDVDLAILEPDAEELTEAEFTQAQADLMSSLTQTPTKITSLTGNGESYTTDAGAKKVTVKVSAPNGGPRRARPQINGDAVLAGIYAFERPGESITVRTRAGNNDLTITEEF